MSPRAASIPVALTIAGSDSGGGAGIQADLKTFASVGVFGTTAVTCLTAQNPNGVSGVSSVPRGFAAKQIQAVFDAFPVSAVKTGMLYSEALINEVVKALEQNRPGILVVDPVARATSGASLLQGRAERVLMDNLLPIADVVTPNIPEAEMILRTEIRSVEDQIDAARAVSKGFDTACLLKGGHAQESRMLDVLAYKGRVFRHEAPRIKAWETHGTGCTLSAALTGYLAKGNSLPTAFRKACSFVQAALARPFKTGAHYPLGIR